MVCKGFCIDMRIWKLHGSGSSTNTRLEGIWGVWELSLIGGWSGGSPWWVLVPLVLFMWQCDALEGPGLLLVGGAFPNFQFTWCWLIHLMSTKKKLKYGFLGETSKRNWNYCIGKGRDLNRLKFLPILSLICCECVATTEKMTWV